MQLPLERKLHVPGDCFSYPCFPSTHDNACHIEGIQPQTCWTLENKEVSGLNPKIILRVECHLPSENRGSYIRDSAHASLLRASKLLFWLNTYLIIENYEFSLLIYCNFHNSYWAMEFNVNSQFHLGRIQSWIIQNLKKYIFLWSIGLKAGFIPTVQNLAHDYTTIKLADLPPFPLKLFSSQDRSWISTILGSWQDYTTRLQRIF